MSAHGNLMDVMCLGHLQDVMKTSDGFFIGMEYGDIGYNAFLGQPNPGDIGRQFSRGTWQALNFTDQKAVVRVAKAKAIDLRIFLPKKGA